MVQAAALSHQWSDEAVQAQITRRLGQAVVASLVLHLMALIAVSWVRLPHHGERPLASIEISLVSVPAPRVNVPEQTVEPPKPAPPVKAAPLPPPPRADAKAPTNSSNDAMRDLLKGIELPPDVPKFGDISPVDRPVKAQLKLPDVPAAPETKEPVSRSSDVKPRPSLTEDMSRELDKELAKIKNLDMPEPAQTASPPKPVPQVEAKVPSVKAVDTSLKVPGIAPGSNAYLGRVRQRISNFWSALPVDVKGQTYVVIVKFRLHRNGTVSGVVIEQSSGNEYYDLAGKRAVVSAIPLPIFPPELTESYFDAHFTFTVGEQNG